MQALLRVSVKRLQSPSPVSKSTAFCSPVLHLKHLATSSDEHVCVSHLFLNNRKLMLTPLTGLYYNFHTVIDK